MTSSAKRTRQSAQRRAGLLALLLFVVGSVAAPPLDAWRHASDAAAGTQDSDPHDCVVCRLASTPTTLPDVPTAPIREGYGYDVPRFAPARTPPAILRARLTPPTRAPPA